MRIVLALALLCTLNLQAQLITVTQVPSGFSENKIWCITQGVDGRYGAKGMTKMFGTSTYYKIDKQFNAMALGGLSKEVKIGYPVFTEVGESFYDLGIAYDQKEELVKFVAVNFNNGEAKTYQTISYSWKENGFFGGLYGYTTSPDKKKLAIIWQNPEDKTQISVYTFDEKLALTGKHSFNCNVETENKKKIEFNLYHLDANGNLLMFLSNKKENKCWFIKYELTTKKLNLEAVDKPANFENVSSTCLDAKQGVFYYMASVRKPSGVGSNFGLTESDLTIDLNNSVAQLYCYNIAQGTTKIISVKLTPEEIEDARKKYDARLAERKLAEAYYIDDMHIYAFDNGNCAAIVDIGYSGMVNMSSGSTPRGNNSTLLRIYNSSLAQVAATHFTLPRQSDNDPRCMMVNNKVHVFTSILVPAENEKIIFQQGCYYIDETGSVKEYFYPKEYPYAEIFRTLEVHSGKIPCSYNRETILLECK